MDDSVSIILLLESITPKGCGRIRRAKFSGNRYTMPMRKSLAGGRMRVDEDIAERHKIGIGKGTYVENKGFSTALKMRRRSTIANGH
jgi:hypothetical protein